MNYSTMWTCSLPKMSKSYNELSSVTLPWKEHRSILYYA